MEELNFGTPAKQEDANRIAWSSKKTEQLLVKIDDGYRPKTTPFYEGNPIYRKGNIVYDYTPEEIGEIQKCATDIVYFANNYCTVMTDEGLRTIVLRPYQEEMLEHFVDNRLSIVLASRQIGKCVLPTSEIKVKIRNNDILNLLPSYYELDEDWVTTIKLYDLNRILKKINNKYTLTDKLKYNLYRLYTYFEK